MTLERLLKKVREGQLIRVLETKTRNDVTHEVLAALWMECEKGRPNLATLLREIIRLTGAQ